MSDWKKISAVVQFVSIHVQFRCSKWKTCFRVFTTSNTGRCMSAYSSLAISV